LKFKAGKKVIQNACIPFMYMQPDSRELHYDRHDQEYGEQVEIGPGTFLKVNSQAG
jgi:hypothetical protein